MNPKIDLPQTLRWEGGELYLLDPVSYTHLTLPTITGV